MFRLTAIFFFALVQSAPYPEPEKSNIINRLVAAEGTIPYQVSIELDGVHICGGSIISSSIVITAAHCMVHNGEYGIRAGSTRRESGGQVIKVKKWKNHPKQDISVLKLKKELNLDGSNVKAIPLVQHNVTTPAKTQAIVSGWGMTEHMTNSDILKYAVVPVVSKAKCRTIFDLDPDDAIICAGFKDGGIEACSMDSGGPLVAKGKLVGIVSWGFDCELPGYPAVYTDVAFMNPWILKQIDKFTKNKRIN